MTALLLLAPQTPMLFQGQEFAASSPFLYFADHYPELATLVAKGRKEFLCQFPTVCQPETQAQLASPGAESTFMRCKLKWDECELHSEIFALHRDLLQIRREDPTFRQQRLRSVDGAILGDHAFVLRFFGEAGADRLLIINFGSDLVLCSQPEPLLAPMPDHGWQVMWSSEEVRYGGSGTPPIEIDGNWRLPGQTAMVLQPA